MNELDVNDVKAIERFLFRLSSADGIADLPPATVQLEVLEAGQWIIKFRRHGIIVNNCELVLRDGIKIDASVSFFTLGNFWATVNGVMTLEEGSMSTSGSEAAMNLFRSKVLKVKSGSSVPPSISTPVPTNRVPRPSSIADDNLPLRSGWLLKKRDLFTGWRSRYFKVYVGRAEYFAEPGDPVPHAVIDLFNAKVTPVAEIRINGQGRGYQIMVEPKKSDKCLKLASELTGEDGKQDAESWYMTFELATKPPAQAHALLSGTKASPQRGGDDSGNNNRDAVLTKGGSVGDVGRSDKKAGKSSKKSSVARLSSGIQTSLLILAVMTGLLACLIGVTKALGLAKGWDELFASENNSGSGKTTSSILLAAVTALSFFFLLANFLVKRL
jgi:hypothetical protein